MTATPRYVGRFAPSPTGPLHAGSLVAALASWLDARAHGGRWLLRIEDVDTPRCNAPAGHFIVHQLARCGLLPDAAPLWQSTRQASYAAALERLVERGLASPCACSRKDIEAQQATPRNARRTTGQERVYPGTCRPERGGLNGRPPRAWRLHTGAVAAARAGAAAPGSACPAPQGWHDRRLGPQQQDVEQQVGDFVLRRADGLWAYQLAVVVDDAAQGVSDVVRGEDLADNTARQIMLQRALGLPTPRYLHVPLVLAADGRKLSKQNGAAAIDLEHPLASLAAAAAALDLPALADSGHGSSIAAALGFWQQAWAARWPISLFD